MAAGVRPIMLIFDRVKTDGEYLVRDGNGTPIVRIQPNRSRSSFVVVATNGSPISSTRRTGFFSRGWTTVDAAGRPLVEFKPSGRGGTATFPNGRTAGMKGHWFATDWILVDDAGHTGVSSQPLPAKSIFGGRPWAVEIIDPAFTIAEVVAIVHSHRLALDAQPRNTATGTDTVIAG